jgi:hypothetical protein
MSQVIHAEDNLVILARKQRLDFFKQPQQR